MLSEGSHVVPVLQENLKPKIKFKYWSKLKRYINLFLESSSVHGFSHLVASRRQYLERFLWLTMITLSTYGSFCLSHLTWSRYQSSPTVISMDRDIFAWNTTFPSVTICPDHVKFIDTMKLEIYLRKHKEENRNVVKEFIFGLANATYQSFENIPQYHGIPPEHYIELLLNLSQEFKPQLDFGIKIAVLNIIPTVTEMGLCYAVNSKVALYNSPKYRADSRWDFINDNRSSIFIHPLDGEVFAQVLNINIPYRAYLHAPEEIPDLTTQSFYSKIGSYLKLSVTALSIYTSAEASRLSVSQRRCRYPRENNLKHNSIYTYTMCRIECRIRLSLKYCHCIPHFYRKIGNEKICDAENFECLSLHKDEFYTLKTKDGKRIECACLPLCDDVYYVVQPNGLQDWVFGTNLQWGMVTYPRMRYRRDIIFGFTDVLETVSIHGLNHLVANRRHYLEIFIWLLVVLLSLFGTLYLSSLTWSRYQSSPTVVSMETDMFAWNTTFPSVTICPDSIVNIDKKKLDKFISEFTEENKTRFNNFILSLANATFKSFEYIPEYSDISPDHYIDLLVNLSLAFKPTLTIDQASNESFTVIPTITEMGLCYAVNSRTAVYNLPKYRSENRWDRLDNEKYSLYIHPLDGEVFAKIAMNSALSYHIYVHGPQEIPDITSKSHRLLDGYVLVLYATAISVYTSAEAAKLTVNQRRCRFPHENNLQHNSIYTYTMCRMECRIQLCLKYCQCIPHFYRRIGDEKICGVEGLHCLSKYKDELFTLQDKDRKRINCGCLPLCDDVNYVLQPYPLQKWLLGTTLQWGVVTYPHVRYRRDIIFGFTDLLVAVGSMAGLFLGCCVLSFLEIVYFLTLRLLCYSYGYR